MAVTIKKRLPPPPEPEKKPVGIKRPKKLKVEEEPEQIINIDDVIQTPPGWSKDDQKRRLDILFDLLEPVMIVHKPGRAVKRYRLGTGQPPKTEIGIKGLIASIVYG